MPSPLHPLFHHLTCIRAAAATLEMLRVSDCPPKISLVLPVPPSPTAPLSGAAPQQGSGVQRLHLGVPTLPGRVKWPHRHRHIEHKLFDAVPVCLCCCGIIGPQKGNPGAMSPPSWQVPGSFPCPICPAALPFHHCRLQLLSAHTEHSPCPLPRFSPCPAPACAWLSHLSLFQGPTHRLSLELQFPFVTQPLTLSTA